MGKKSKNYLNLFIFFLIVFYPIKSSASTLKCDLFIDALLANYQPEFNYLPGDTYLNDFGFLLSRRWDGNNKKYYDIKDKNGNFIVGKIHRLDLAKNIKSGNSIIKINDQKFINDEKQKEILLKNDKIKFEFFDPQKGNFILDIARKEQILTDVLFDIEDISVNSIDLKKGTFEVRLKYDAGYQFFKNAHEKLYSVAEDTIIFEKDGWHWEVCIFTEEEFKKSRMRDPGNQIVLLDIAMKDKDLLDVYYKLTPYSKKFGNPGNHLYLEKKIEGVFNIKNKFNLHTFPFDKQVLSLTFIDGRFNLDQRQILYTYNTYESLDDYAGKNEIPGWNVTGYEINPLQYQDEFYKGEDFGDGFSLDILIERKHGYYIFKLIIPIFLILMICWSVVWIHPRELESRLTITIICLLSLIAYNFVIDEELPKLEYLTVLDWLILVSYIYATIPNFLTIASFRFLKTNKQLTIKMENYGKRYGATSYVVIIFIIIFVNVNLNPENSSALISWMGGR